MSYLCREINQALKSHKTVTAVLAESGKRVAVTKCRSEIGQSLQVMSPDNPSQRYYKIIESSVEVSDGNE